MIEAVLSALSEVADLGGPVVLVLVAVAVAAGAVVLYKLWQFAAAGVGQHKALGRAIDAWDRGDRRAAREELSASRSYLAPVVDMALTAPDAPEAQTRLTAEAEARFAGLERGLRFLDIVAQLAPLLGLFGTVLGMIEAFRSLQEAGAQVDPAILAGGIWVALLTTAAGLAVAMPVALILSWFEGRMDAERVLAERAIATIRAPLRGGARQAAPAAAAHA